MNPETIIKIIISITIILFFYFRAKFTKHSKKKIKKTSVKYIIAIPLLLIYILGYIDFALLPINFLTRIITGGILIIGGLTLFFKAHKQLGKNWSPIIEKKFDKSRNLIKTGPYKYIRHPIYTASFITLLGLGILSANWLLFGIPLVILIIFYSKKIPKEENELITNFGKPYKEYMKTTGSLIPKI